MSARVSIVIGILSLFQLAWGTLAFGQGRHGGWGGRDDNRPMSSDEIAQRVARTTDFLKKIDANGNGVIDPDEASDPQAKNMLDRIFSRMGKEQHYPMAISEIMQGYEAYYRSRGSAGGSPNPAGSQPGSSTSAGPVSPPGMGFGSPATPASGGSSSNSSPSRPAVSPAASIAPTMLTPSAGLVVPSPASASSPAATSTAAPSLAAPSTTDTKPAPRKPVRFLTSRERLPKGLPDWFLEKDVDGTGQITMAQFSTSWTPEKLAEFNRYDLNHDGIITAAECLKVEKAQAGSK